MRSEKLTEKYMIREAAKQVGVEAHVLRYWEKELSLEVPKNDMGHRFYTAYEIRLLSQVKYLKDQGFHLKAIRYLKKNIDEIAQLDTAKLHSLRDRLNGQVLTESLARQREEENAEKEREIVAIHTGTPTGKKIKIVEEQTEQASPLLELELVQPKEQAVRSFDVLQGGRMEKTPESDGRMEQFRMIMSDIIGEALRENNKELAKNVGGSVSETVMKEIDDRIYARQQEEEERYRKLDEVIRMYQRSRQEAAAEQESGTKKKHGIFSAKKQEKLI